MAKERKLARKWVDDDNPNSHEGGRDNPSSHENLTQFRLNPNQGLLWRVCCESSGRAMLPLALLLCVPAVLALKQSNGVPLRMHPLKADKELASLDGVVDWF